jgi:mutator protein MutT
MVNKQIAIGIVRYQGKILIDLRPEHVPLGGLWEFPGGKVKAEETLEQCVHREVLEEVGLEIKVIEPLVFVRHDYPDFSIDLTAFLCDASSDQAQAIACQEVRWVLPEELTNYTFPPANAAILEALRILGN